MFSVFSLVKLASITFSRHYPKSSNVLGCGEYSLEFKSKSTSCFIFSRGFRQLTVEFSTCCEMLQFPKYGRWWYLESTRQSSRICWSPHRTLSSGDIHWCRARGETVSQPSAMPILASCLTCTLLSRPSLRLAVCPLSPDGPGWMGAVRCVKSDFRL